MGMVLTVYVFEVTANQRPVWGTQLCLALDLPLSELPV